MLSEMKKPAAKRPKKQKVNWETVAERTRQECNKLSSEERRRLLDDALRLIYSGNTKTPTRSP
jgi:hypothetical protein